MAEIPVLDFASFRAAVLVLASPHAAASLSGDMQALLTNAINANPNVALSVGIEALRDPLASLAFKAIPSGSWPYPISSLHSLLLQSDSPKSQKLANTKTFLSLVTVFAQEIVNYSFAVISQRIVVYEHVRHDLHFILTVIGQVLDANPHELGSDLFEVKQEALKCVLAWAAVEKGVPVESLPRLLSLVTNHLQYPQTFDAACNVLTELLTFKDLLSHEKTICEGLLPILTSDTMLAECRRCLEERDSDTAQTICALLSQVGESFPKYIVKNLANTPASQHILRLIEAVLHFTAFPGTYGVDEEVSHLTDAFWFELEETLTDDTVIPTPAKKVGDTAGVSDISTDPVTHEPVIHGTGAGLDGTRIVTRYLDRGFAAAAAVASTSIPGGWNVDAFPEGFVEGIWAVAKEIFESLTGILINKVSRPNESEFSSWNSDTREKFRIYRHDKAETLLACHRILGDRMQVLLTNYAGSTIRQIKENGGEDGQALEGILFCLKSVAEELNLKNSPHLHYVFGEIMGQIASFPPQFWRARQTFCLLIGESRIAMWLRKNPQYILPVINFLVASLDLSVHLTTPAIHSLEQVCSVCRNQLGAFAQDMINAWNRLKNSLSRVDRIRLIRAVSSVLEPLTLQEQLPHVMTLTGSMITEIRTNLAVLAASPNLLSQPLEAEVAEKMLVCDLLRLLKGVCQGIQKSEGADDVSDDMAEDEKNESAKGSDAAVVSDSGDVMDQIDDQVKANLQMISNMLWETVVAVFQVFVNDEETIDVCCGLVTIAISTSIPIMFTPNPVRLANLLTQSFSINKFPIILRVLNVLLQSVREGEPSMANNDAILSVGTKSALREWVQTVLVSVNETTFAALVNDGNMQERPDLIEQYFKLVCKVLAHHTWGLLLLPANHHQMLFGTLATNGLALQERVACVAVFDFVRDLVSFKVADGVGVVRASGPAAARRRRAVTGSMQSESEEFREAKECKERVEGIVKSIGPDIVRVLFADIGTGLPTSMWPMIADLLHRIIHYYPNDARQWITSCLQVEGFPSPHCSKLDKEEFLKGMMVAQTKAFKDLVKKFGLKCRNLQDTVYGSGIRI
ncbi:hypothetical protein HDU84_000125 [Entophlyctis sp. JEL0112]|nr:hypothetical protein HDU84_000125 [Entophlyctis sp. JEL0112]